MSIEINRWNEALKEQHKIIFDYNKKVIRKEYACFCACPVCGLMDAADMLEKDWFRWVRCRNCSMVYMYPRLTDSATHQFYNSEANAIYNASKFEALTSSSIFDDQENASNVDMIDQFRHAVKGNLLEIGSGKGYFLKKAKESGYKVYGLELNKRLCQYSRELLGEGNEVYDVDLLDAEFPSETFDVIYMRDLIQHIPRPVEFLQECFRIAKPGCTIFIGTHNIDSLISRIVRSKYTPVFGFMEPNHYSPRTIRTLLEKTGFFVRDIQFRSLDFTIGEIISYFGASTFTTVYPIRRSLFRQILVRILRAPFYRWPLRYLDQYFTPRIANGLKQGSWMNVLAEKRRS